MTAAGAQLTGVMCGVDGSPHARHAANAALAFAERLGMRLTLVHVAPTRTLLPVASLPADVDPSAYARSLEVEVQAAEAFDSPSPEVSRADVDYEVRLGELATVLAELAEQRRAELVVVGSRGTRCVALGCDGFRVRRARAACVLPGRDRAA